MKRLAAACAVLALPACAGDPAPAARPTGTASVSPTPSATAQPSATPTASPVPSATALPTDLADGQRHYVRLKSLDAKKRTVTVDVVQFLTGEAAEKAAAEDDQEAFDYYIRNTNPRLRTLTYAASVEVVVNTLTAHETGSSTKDTPVTVAKLAGYLAQGEAQRRVFWLTLAGGRVVTLTEQYLP